MFGLSISYRSSDFGKPPHNENDFHIESIKEIESPNKGIELTYSFNCILLSDSNEIIEIKNAKGKCSFIYWIEQTSCQQCTKKIAKY